MLSEDCPSVCLLDPALLQLADEHDLDRGMCSDVSTDET